MKKSAKKVTKKSVKKLTKKNPKKLTFEEAQDKLDDLGVKLRDNDEWDCYEVYPMYGLRENDPLHSYTQDRSEESLQEAYKKGLQLAKKLGKFSKIIFDPSKELAQKKTRNPKPKYTKDDLALANSWVKHYANLITEARAKRQVDKVRKYMDKWNDAVIKRDQISDYFNGMPRHHSKVHWSDEFID